MRSSLLKYEVAEPLSEAGEKLRKAKSALTTSNASLDDVLNALLAPRVDEAKNEVSFVSKTQSTPLELIQLSELLENQLIIRQARSSGQCPIRFNAFDELFDELIRQTTLECKERGLFLQRLKQEIHGTLHQKRLLFQNALAFAHGASSDNDDAELQRQVIKLTEENIALKRQAAELRYKVERLDQAMQESKELDKKRFDDEKAFLTKFVEQLKTQFKQFLAEQQ